MVEAIEPEIVDEDDDLIWSLTDPLLNEAETKFAAAVASGAHFSDAYRIAYPEKDVASSTIRVYAAKLAKNPKVRQQIDVIQQGTRLHFILDAPRAAAKMTALSQAASSEKIQFEATKDILNRGGLQPPQRIETIHVGVFGSASQEDIRDLLRKKLEHKEDDE